MPQQPTPQPLPTATPVPQLGPGVQALRDLVAKSQAQNAQAQPAGAAPAAPQPPSIRTDSLSGLWQSFKDRLSYAMYGAPQTQTPPPVTPPK